MNNPENPITIKDKLWNELFSPYKNDSERKKTPNITGENRGQRRQREKNERRRPNM